LVAGASDRRIATTASPKGHPQPTLLLLLLLLLLLVLLRGPCGDVGVR
jgi:MYXO-CTERM domain-containing protein